MDAEEKILKTLKDFGTLSTSKIANIVGSNYYFIEGLLNKLLAEKKVKRKEETLAIYWSLI